MNKEYFTTCAGAAVAMGKCFQRIAKLHKMLGSDANKAMNQIERDAHTSMSAECDDLSSACADLAEAHIACGAAMDNSDDDGSAADADKVRKNLFGMSGARDYSQIVPDGVYKVLPDVPQNRLVARPGSAPITKSSVPPEFAHLVDE